jgi:hypothetical protein
VKADWPAEAYGPKWGCQMEMLGKKSLTSSRIAKTMGLIRNLRTHTMRLSRSSR